MNPITVFLGGPATPRHEHHLRDDQGARHDDPDADIDGRQHESRRGLGFGRTGQDCAGQCERASSAEQPLRATEKRLQGRRAPECSPANLTHRARGLVLLRKGPSGQAVC